MRKIATYAFGVVWGCAFAHSSFAQSTVVTPPFYSGTVVGYDPIVSVASSGPTLVASAVVSADRKYVTLGMQPTNLAIQGFSHFTSVSGATGGTVGIPAATTTTGAAKAQGNVTPRPLTILEKPGMVLITPLP